MVLGEDQQSTASGWLGIANFLGNIKVSRIFKISIQFSLLLFEKKAYLIGVR
jgi:hypothetical protein